jgi:ribosomal protein S18 acetylase RimI-like enzyme
MACVREVLGARPTESDDGLADIEARATEFADQGFLRALYASTREDEMRATYWPASRCRAFLDQQFDFQQRYYRTQHPQAQFLLLLRAAQPIGRLYWRSDPGLATLIDMSLVPPARGQGLGTALLRLLTGLADAQGQVVELHVEPDNQAQRLYRRFGFVVETDNNIHLRMRRACTGPRRVLQ